MAERLDKQVADRQHGRTDGTAFSITERPQTSLDRALDILEALGTDGPRMSLGDLSAYLEMAKPTVRRVLINLIERGYVEQDPHTRDYRLGIRSWQIGAAAVAAADLRTVAEGRLEALAQATGEQATLWVYDAGDAVCIDRAEGPQRVRSFTRLGTRELTVGLSSGRCLLSGQAEDEIERVLTGLDSEQRTARTVEEWRDHLKLVAERGYDISTEDRWEGVSATGAAVHDHTGKVVGAVAVSGPSHRVEAAMDALVHEVRGVADTMSAHLGHSIN